MGLLAPLFLGGVLAIALPIWLHRLQTKSSVRESFSSAMLLESSDQQIHVKKQLKYLLLLALRIGFLLLLVLAFAQPFLERPPTTVEEAAAGTHLIVVDTSISMGRAGLMDEAKQQAQRAIDASPEGALVQLMAAADGLQILSDIETGISTMEVTSARLDYGRMVAELENYAESLPPPVSLHFVSDFQASGMPPRFSDLVASSIAAFTPWPVTGSASVNWSVEFLRQTSSGIEVGVQNRNGAATDATVRITVNGIPQASRPLAGDGRELLAFTIAEFEPGDNRIEVAIEAGDVLPADNRWFAIVENDPPDPVPLLTAQVDGLAVTYLSAALESSAANTFQVTPVPVSELDPRILTRYKWAVTDDIGALGGPLESAIREYIESGGNLLAFAAERSLALETLPISGHRLQAGSLRSGQFMSIGQIDTQHPSLAATEGWYRVNVSQTVPLEISEEDQVLLRLENSQPLLIERRIGAGRLMLVLSSADNRWNDLPLHPVFVGFIIETASYLSGGENIAASYTVGDRLPLSLIGSASGQVVDPDGNAVLSLAGTAQAQQIKLDKSGIYEVYTPQGETLVAVNLDPRESELAPLADDIVTRWQEASNRQVPMEENESIRIEAPPLELWHWLLLIAALILIAESALGNHYLASGLRPG